MSNDIFILTGPIHSGKTTWLINKIVGRQIFSGILQPVANGKRVILDIHTGLSAPLEADIEMDNDIVHVGKYKFKQSTFDWAKDVLKQSIEHGSEWIVIDEIGKIEIINDQGLEPIVSELINMRINNTLTSKLLLVIRDTLVESALAKYSLQNAVIKVFAEMKNDVRINENFSSFF